LDKVLQHKFIHWDKAAKKSAQQDLLGEEPLSIRIEGNPYAVVMRTPGDEIPHVAGFCLTEGIIDTPDDLTSIGFCEDDDTNVVTITLTPSRRGQITEILDRRGFISQTSCGLCGKELVKDLYQIIKPLEASQPIEIKKALTCLEALPNIQPFHNALDKAIGKVFLSRQLDRAELLILSSRISYELVQKSARARIPVILAHSRPTALAVDLAANLNMTVASLDDNDAGLYVFCGEQRLFN
jgi:FdhD protein